MPVSDPRLLIPATAALVEGWCGPVVVNYRGRHYEASLWNGGVQTIHGTEGKARRKKGEPFWPGVESTFLDLSRAECRDRVVRCLAIATGHTVPNGVTWSCSSYHRRRCWHLFAHLAPLTDRTGPVPDTRPAHFGGKPWPNRGWYRAVPALADLDPASDERLPDGSRLVDALALAVVARAVLCE
jgi:hypothetical protein